MPLVKEPTRGDRSWLLLKHRGGRRPSKPGSRPHVRGDTSVHLRPSPSRDIRGRAHLPDRGPQGAVTRADCRPSMAFRRGQSRRPTCGPMQGDRSPMRPFTKRRLDLRAKSSDGIRALVPHRGTARAAALLAHWETSSLRSTRCSWRRWAHQPASTLVLDGEIVAPDERGRCRRSSGLQERMKPHERGGSSGRPSPRVPGGSFYAFRHRARPTVFDLRRVAAPPAARSCSRGVAPAVRRGVRPERSTSLARGETAFDASVGSRPFEGRRPAKRPRTASTRQGKTLAKLGSRSRTRSRDEFVIVGLHTRQTARGESTFGSLLLGQYEVGRVRAVNACLCYSGTRPETGFRTTRLLRGVTVKTRRHKLSVYDALWAMSHLDARGSGPTCDRSWSAEVKFRPKRTDDGLSARNPSFVRPAAGTSQPQRLCARLWSTRDRRAERGSSARSTRV